jgi:hypothetical protein
VQEEEVVLEGKISQVCEDHIVSRTRKPSARCGFLSAHLLGAGRLAMRRWCPAVLLGCVVALSVLVAAVECVVAYDKKVVLIDGQMRILFSGSIHYPRSTPDVTAFYKISSPPTIP